MRLAAFVTSPVFYIDLREKKKPMIHSIRKTKNRIFAMPAAVPAIPAKPNIAAIIAMTRKTRVQCNMFVSSRLSWSNWFANSAPTNSYVQ